MATLAIILSAAAIYAIAFSSVCIKRYGLRAVLGGVKRCVKILILLLFVAAALLICFMSCYAQMCEILKEIFTARSLENIKKTLKTMSGADSAFIALQTIAMVSAMISFVSCLVCIFGVLIVLIIDPAPIGCVVITAKEGSKPSLPEGYTHNAFLVYSRYNS